MARERYFNGPNWGIPDFPNASDGVNVMRGVKSGFAYLLDMASKLPARRRESKQPPEQPPIPRRVRS